ncbi:YhfH family protein [Thalassobacillus hwangdonensis]|uniref:YhfH family protein n=1 Tax=Thalassobacillus hwangdonensis TaxID=546108 RepID=A0ABW3L5M7_9BACI
MNSIKVNAHACPECGSNMDGKAHHFILECERCLSKKEE